MKAEWDEGEKRQCGVRQERRSVEEMKVRKEEEKGMKT
jgi:hypothetical protein